MFREGSVIQMAMDLAVWRPLVLLVDDDVRTGLRLARMLREDGYDVDFAADGAEAITRLARDPLPDVLVTDLTMPFADGVAVMGYARSRRADLPVFVISGYPVLMERAPRPPEPAPVVLIKPIDYDSLSRQIGLAVGRPQGAHPQ